MNSQSIIGIGASLTRKKGIGPGKLGLAFRIYLTKCKVRRGSLISKG
jgi:hypothetical protein